MCTDKKVYDGCRRHNYQPFGEVCETVQAYYGGGGNNTPIVLEYHLEKCDGNKRVGKGINYGDVAAALDAHYYLGCGARGGVEREVVYFKEEPL